MKANDLKSARLSKGWTQVQAASHMGVTQAYWNYLENGRRKLTPKLVQKAMQVFELSADAFPVAGDFVPVWAGNDLLTNMLARLEYPGFSHVLTRAPRKNPSEVLLTSLVQPSLDARVAEALPWVALKFAKPEPWLVDNSRKLNLQNKLGFVVTLARRVAERRGENPNLSDLRQLEETLDESRLAKEDFFYRPPFTETEKDWLKKNRSQDAAHWNLLSDMKPEHLPYAS